MLWVTSLKDKCISASAQRRAAQVQVNSMGKWGSKDPERGWTPLERALVTNME